jgi:hypothetical protein
LVPLEGSIAARRRAPLHVQIELAPFPPNLRTPLKVEIKGQVVRVFRGEGLIKLGDSVSFDLWVCVEGDEPTGPAYVYYKNLITASHVEAYLSGTPPKCVLEVYEFTLLDGPTLEPKMSVEELVELMQSWREESESTVGPLRSDGLPESMDSIPEYSSKRKRWWQFWSY